ncbi:MAG: TonB-dependent receptor [Acidobacteriaceae bacterium]
MRRARGIRARQWLCALAMLFAASAWAAEYHGQVFVQGVPVPGATVTLSQDGQQVSTVTDGQGVYEFPNLKDGVWKIEIRMRGFATLKSQVTVGPNRPQGKFELTLLGLQQMLAQSKVTTPEAPPNPQLATRAAEKKKPEAAPAAMPPPPEESNEQTADGLLVNGSDNNAATSKYSLSPAFGNRRPGTRGLYTGGFASAVGNSAFDARPYSLTGFQVPKAEYSEVIAGVTLGGPLIIPHLFYHGPEFFVAYQWTRDSTGSTDPALMPDAAERSGDLSGLTNPLGQPLTIYNPATGQPFTGPVPVSPQAQALLNLYPLPNIPGDARYNYESEVLSHTHMDALESRLDKTLGRRDQVYGGFGFKSTRADAANVFNFVDTTDTLGLDGHVNWAHQYSHDIYAVLGYHFTRLRTLLRPEFENRENISGNAGITGNDQNAQDWGPPSLTFLSIQGLNDGNSEFNRNRTDAFSLKLSTTQRRHTISFGGDYREQEFNEYTESNPRGTFTFTGAATAAPGTAAASPGAVSTSGSDLADFLIGIPDTSAVAFGNPEKYFRQPAYDAYAMDDFRVEPNLTINAGLRWEYGAPMTELYGRMVNLDIAPGFTAAAPVLAGNPTGPLTGTKYPASLVRPDRSGFEPRVAISWRPIPASTLVVRAGYGVYDDTSVYLSSAEAMAQQAPLSKSLQVANSSACPLTLANGFVNCAGITADTYAVDPNLRVGYAQVWQLSMQKDLPGALVGTATYSGVKGTRGMQEFLPNTYPSGAANPCPSCPAGFVYRTSNGNSTREAGEVQLRRRLRGGLTASVDYTWSKSLDDDSVVGATGHAEAQAAFAAPSDTSTSPSTNPTVAQNWLDPGAERGLSTFDQRNLVTAEFQYTTGMGLTETLLSGWRGTLFKEWTVMTKMTAGSGLPETPELLTAIPGTGVTGPLRPNVTGAPLYKGPAGYFLNAAAYAAPAAGEWGDARRDSIVGPDEFTLDAALARTFRLRSTRNLDVRIDATNPLNHASYTDWNTVVNGTTFGLPAAVNPMRSLQVTGRLRF